MASNHSSINALQRGGAEQRHAAGRQALVSSRCSCRQGRPARCAHDRACVTVLVVEVVLLLR